MQANQRTLHRQIRSQFQGKRKIPFVAGDHEAGHGRDMTWTLRAKQAPEHISEAWIGTSWIVEVTASGTRDGKPFQAIHLFLTSLRTTPEALLQLVRDRWSDGHPAHGSDEPAEAGWLPLDPDWLTGGDARHHGIAGDGAATPLRSPALQACC